MSTITIEQLANVPALKSDRLVNSMVAACSQAVRSCGGCPHKKKPNPSTCITLLKTVSSKHGAVITAAFNLPTGTKFIVSRTDKAIVLSTR